MAQVATVTTENPDFGFYGTVRSQGLDADTAWAAAVEAIVAFYPVMNPRIAARRARIFLDSAGGRHLADSIDGDLSRIGAVLPSFAGWMN